MAIKALATELDRILTGPNDSLDLFAVEAMRLLNAAGVPTVFVTSHDCTFAQCLSSFLGGSKVIVAETGSVIQDYGTRQPPQVLGDPAVIARGLDVLRAAHGNQLQVLPSPGRLCSAVARKSDRFTTAEVNAILEEADVRAQVLALGQTYVLTDTAFNKGAGLLAAVKMLGIPLEQFAAIGENDHDLAMFRVIGHRIAIGNASPAVKDQADFVCVSNYGRGFCEAVDHLLRLRNVDLGSRETSPVVSA